MFGKCQANYQTLWANTIKLFSHLIAFASLHTVSRYLPLRVSLRSNLQKYLLFSESSCAETLFLTKITDFSSFLLKITGAYRYSYSHSHCIAIFQSFYDSCWRINNLWKVLLAKPNQETQTKTLLLLFTKQHNARKFCFSVCFLPFFCLFLSFFLLKPIKKY